MKVNLQQLKEEFWEEMGKMASDKFDNDDMHHYELSNGVGFRLNVETAKELREQINEHLRLYDPEEAAELHKARALLNISEEQRDLLQKFLRKVALACADTLIFEALCTVFAETVEGFEKPKTEDGIKMFWAPPEKGHRYLVSQEAYDLLPVDVKAYCDVFPAVKDIKAAHALMSDDTDLHYDDDGCGCSCDCCDEDDDEEYYNAGGEFISHKVFPQPKEGDTEKRITYIFAQGGEVEALPPDYLPPEYASLPAGGKGCTQGPGKTGGVMPPMDFSGFDRFVDETRRIMNPINSRCNPETAPVEECPECFGTGFKGGFQAPCSRGCSQ